MCCAAILWNSQNSNYSDSDSFHHISKSEQSSLIIINLSNSQVPSLFRFTARSVAGFELRLFGTVGTGSTSSPSMHTMHTLTEAQEAQDMLNSIHLQYMFNTCSIHLQLCSEIDSSRQAELP